MDVYTHAHGYLFHHRVFISFSTGLYIFAQFPRLIERRLKFSLDYIYLNKKQPLSVLKIV